MRPPAVHGPFAGRTWLVTSVPLPPSRVNLLAGLRSFEARMAALAPERERPRRRRRPAPPPRVSSLRRMRGTQSEADLRQERSRPDSPASAYSEDQARCSTIASIDRILSSMHSLQAELGGPEAPLPPPVMPETIPEEPDSPPPQPARQLPHLDSQMSLDEMFNEIETLYDSLRNQNAKNGGGGGGDRAVKVAEKICTAGGDFPKKAQSDNPRGDCATVICDPCKPVIISEVSAVQFCDVRVPREPPAMTIQLDHSPASLRARSVPADVRRTESLNIGPPSQRGVTLSPQTDRQPRRSASARTARPPAPPPAAADQEVQYDVPRWPQPVPAHVRGPSAPAVMSAAEEVVYDTPRPVAGRPPLPLPAEPALPPRSAAPPPPPLPVLGTFSTRSARPQVAARPKPAVPVPQPPEIPPHPRTTVGSAGQGRLVRPLPPKPPVPPPSKLALPPKPCLSVPPVSDNHDILQANNEIPQTDSAAFEKSDSHDVLQAATVVIPETDNPDNHEIPGPDMAVTLESENNASLFSAFLPKSVPPKPVAPNLESGPVTDHDYLPDMSPPLPLPPKPAVLVIQMQSAPDPERHDGEKPLRPPTPPPPTETEIPAPEEKPSPPPVPQHGSPPDQTLPPASHPPNTESPSEPLPPKPGPIPAHLEPLLPSSEPPASPDSQHRPPLQHQTETTSCSPSAAPHTPPVPAHGPPTAPQRLESAARLLEGLTAPLAPARPESPAGRLSDARRRAVALLLDDQLLLPVVPCHDPACGPPGGRTPRLARPATTAGGGRGRRRLDTPPGEEDPVLPREGRGDDSHPAQRSNGAPGMRQNCDGVASEQQGKNGPLKDPDAAPALPPREPRTVTSREMASSPDITPGQSSDVHDDSLLGLPSSVSSILETPEISDASSSHQTQNLPPLPRAASAQPAAMAEDGPPVVPVSERAEKLQRQLAIRQPGADGAVRRSPGGSAREDAETERHGGPCRVA